MKHQLVWTHTGTAIVSFALGWALTHKFESIAESCYRCGATGQVQFLQSFG